MHILGEMPKTPDSVSLTELRGDKLYDVLGQVEHLRRAFTITRYGRPVARIVPIESGKSVLDLQVPVAGPSPA
jgi:prevent-host-death family protein